MNSAFLKWRIYWAMKNGKTHKDATIDSYREIVSEYGKGPSLSQISESEKRWLRKAKLIQQKKTRRTRPAH